MEEEEERGEGKERGGMEEERRGGKGREREGREGEGEERSKAEEVANSCEPWLQIYHIAGYFLGVYVSRMDKFATSKK